MVAITTQVQPCRIMNDSRCPGTDIPSCGRRPERAQRGPHAGCCPDGVAGAVYAASRAVARTRPSPCRDMINSRKASGSGPNSTKSAQAVALTILGIFVSNRIRSPQEARSSRNPLGQLLACDQAVELLQQVNERKFAAVTRGELCNFDLESVRASGHGAGRKTHRVALARRSTWIEPWDSRVTSRNRRAHSLTHFNAFSHARQFHELAVARRDPASSLVIANCRACASVPRISELSGLIPDSVATKYATAVRAGGEV